MDTKKLVPSVLAMALVVTLALCAANAQSGTGKIKGVVKDATGGVLVGATVTIDGPVTQSDLTGPVGEFEFAELPAGKYTVSATQPGFAPVEQANVEVKDGVTTEVALTLAVTIKETVVVTASRIQTTLEDAPATVSVVGGGTLLTSTAANMGDALRSVPGLNVVQTSAREINLASRQSSPTLTNTELALLDGRAIYADFFNIVFWDFVPTNTSDIKQIEVIRGPASAMWGANAATGVVNIITKTPRESQGMSLTLTGGGFSRDVGSGEDKGAGAIFGVQGSFSHAPNERWAYRTSASYYSSSAFPRPTGTIPVSPSPLDPSIQVGGGSYGDSAFANRGTRQPKFDIRADQELGGGRRMSYSGGIAWSQGIIHSPIGPFDLQKGARFGYGRAGYGRGNLHISGFMNLLHGEAPNLLTRDAQGRILRVDFDTATFDLEGGDSQLAANRHLLTYGGNVRRNHFDISLAPGAKDRTEIGTYLQDEIYLGRLRFTLSARLDKFGNLGNAFFSPRGAIAYRLMSHNAARFSYNRSFRAPSAIDNYLDIAVISAYLPLGLIDPRLGNQLFPIPTRTVGNPALKAEELDAYELGYTGSFERTKVGAAFYVNTSDRIISSAAGAQKKELLGYDPFYNSKNPPPGWPLPPEVLDLLAAQGYRFQAIVKTLNLGRLRNKGFEFSLDHAVNSWANAFANYSFQALPKRLDPVGDPLRLPAQGVGVPPRHRLNLGFNLSRDRYLSGFTINHAGRAFWSEVLADPFYGYTKAYTMVNASFGWRWVRGKITTLIRGTNLLNKNIQQHIFGDIMKRTILSEIRFAI